MVLDNKYWFSLKYSKIPVTVPLQSRHYKVIFETSLKILSCCFVFFYRDLNINKFRSNCSPLMETNLAFTFILSLLNVVSSLPNVTRF